MVPGNCILKLLSVFHPVKGRKIQSDGDSMTYLPIKTKVIWLDLQLVNQILCITATGFKNPVSAQSS